VAFDFEIWFLKFFVLLEKEGWSFWDHLELQGIHPKI
jgi:hypothetical protein